MILSCCKIHRDILWILWSSIVRNIATVIYLFVLWKKNKSCKEAFLYNNLPINNRYRSIDKLQISWIKLRRCKSVKISTFVLAFLVVEYGLFIQLTHSLYNHPECRNFGKLFSFKRFFWNVKFNQFKCRWTVYEWIKNFKYQIEVHDGFTLYLRANMFNEEIMFLLWKVRTLKCLIYFTAWEIELRRELSAR